MVDECFGEDTIYRLKRNLSPTHSACAWLSPHMSADKMIRWSEEIFSPKPSSRKFVEAGTSQELAREK